MKQKINVNGDIESRRRIAECRSVPARENISPDNSRQYHVNPEKPDVPLNKNDAFQKVQKRRVQEKR